MAKWVYERWSVKWDVSNPSGTYTAMPSVLYVIDIVTVLGAIEGTSPPDPVMALTQSDFRDAFNAGLEANVRYGYAGQRGSIPYFTVTRETLAQRRLKDARLEDIVLEEGAVPDDGIHTDGYWYIKVKPVFPTMRILRDGQWAEVETGFVLKDGVWEPIEEIYKLQDGQWVQA